MELYNQFINDFEEEVTTLYNVKNFKVRIVDTHTYSDGSLKKYYWNQYIADFQSGYHLGDYHFTFSLSPEMMDRERYLKILRDSVIRFGIELYEQFFGKD